MNSDPSILYPKGWLMIVMMRNLYRKFRVLFPTIVENPVFSVQRVPVYCLGTPLTILQYSMLPS